MAVNRNILFVSFCVFLQISFACCTIAEVLERFWVLSCEFSSAVEKYLPSGGREKRSVDEPNSDDPDKLFNYLYPLADLNPEDLAEEVQRSSSNPGQDTIYVWVTDLGHLWLAECRSRYGRNKEENVEEMDPAEESETEDEESLTEELSSGESVHSSGYSLSGQRRGDAEINYRSGNMRTSPSRNRRSTSSSYSSVHNPANPRSVSAHHEGNRADSPAQPRNKSSNTTRPGPKYRKKPLKGIPRRREDMSSSNLTTAAPPPAEETFFSSYGGDIEYFFPLISFGIPFDGEITFLGFHGFKGLFPYR